MHISNTGTYSTQLLQSPQRKEQVFQEDSYRRARQESEPAVSRLADSESVESFKRRIEFSQIASQSRLASQVNTSSLPTANQRAIGAYENSRPSIEQQLGVEIMGIDTYA